LHARINPKALSTAEAKTGTALDAVLQYDYLTAYLDFFNPAGPKVAGAIAKKYLAHPVVKKRKLFEEIDLQLKEAAGVLIEEKKAAIDDSRERKLANLASTDPTLDFSIEGTRIEINYANLTKVTANYFVMDIELLFSSKPFIKDNDNDFLFVSPNFSQVIDLPAGKTTHVVDIPEKYRNANVYVELIGPGGGLSKCKTCYSHSLSVQVIENYGQVKVTTKNTAKPVPMTYVKVFSKHKDTGVHSFYKDGYTDRRGRFDYASLSTSKLPDVGKFSILIMSDASGSCVREANKPAT